MHGVTTTGGGGAFARSHDDFGLCFGACSSHPSASVPPAWTPIRLGATRPLAPRADCRLILPSNAGVQGPVAVSLVAVWHVAVSMIIFGKLNGRVSVTLTTVRHLSLK